MLQIERVKLEPEEDESLLRRRAAAALRVPETDVLEVRVLRKAIDAREGVRFVYTLRVEVKNEKNVLKCCKNKNVAPVSETPYRLPDPVDPPEVPPVVVGAGPGGLFCALALARCGARPILLERGRNVLGERDAGPGVQRPIRRGRRGRVFRRQAEYRHQRHAPPLHTGNPDRPRRAGEHPPRCQAPCGHRLPPQCSGKPAAGADGAWL